MQLSHELCRLIGERGTIRVHEMPLTHAQQPPADEKGASEDAHTTRQPPSVPESAASGDQIGSSAAGMTRLVLRPH